MKPELKELIARLRDGASQYPPKQPWWMYRKEMREAANALGAISEDAERYRWLHQFDEWKWQPQRRGVLFHWFIRCQKEELDAAIDAALSGDNHE